MAFRKKKIYIYPKLSKNAQKQFYHLTRLTYTAFSAFTVIKNKYRLNVESILSVTISCIKPNMETIIPQVQAQVSHQNIINNI